MAKPKKTVPSVTEVTVMDGVITPATPKIPNQGILALTNEDLNFYRVQLTVADGAAWPPMCAILPPLGTLVLMGGPTPGDQNTHCKFAVYVTNMMSPEPPKGGTPKISNGGGHTIIIGSGGTKKKQKHKKDRR
jgi:hypothetical protein